MKTTTHVYIPVNRNKDDPQFIEWCMENVSFYSTEYTWIAERKASLFLIYRFGEATDALAFKLKFGL
jgi:hypothetical protein